MMNSHVYRLRADTIYDEDMNSFIVYGIDALCVANQRLTSFPDVFFDRGKAERFIQLCNEESLSFLHITDAIEDCLS